MVWRTSAGHSASRQNFIALTILLLTVLAACCVFAGGSQAAASPLPGKVSSLKIKPSSGALTITWKAPATVKNAAVTGYRIDYRKVGAKSWKEAKKVSARKTTLRVAGLRNGTSYELRILARSVKGYGAPRIVKGVPRERGVGDLGTDKPVLIPPDVPDQFRVVPGKGRITADWVAPVLIGSSPVSGFDLRYRVLPDGAWQMRSTPVNEPAITVDNLSSSHDYELNVRSVSAAGAGVWSTPRFATPFPPSLEPGPPLNLSATGGLNSIDVKWDEPAFLGDEPVNFYELRTRAPGGSWASIPVEAPTRTFTLVNVVTNDVYDWQVRAVDEGGEASLWSNLASASRAITPEPPILLTAARADGAVSLNWLRAPGGGPPDSYSVRYRPIGGVSWTTSLPVGATSHMVTGLANGTMYEFQVLATNRGGSSEYTLSVNATPAAVPGIPQSLTLTPGDGSLSATWSAPLSTGGLPITYSFSFKPSASSTWSAPEAVTGTSRTVTGLTNGTSYDVAVSAVNSAGAGEQRTATGVPATVPGVPGGFTVTPDIEEVAASWIAPAVTGGAPITGYELRYRVSPAGAWTSVSRTAAQLGITLTSLPVEVVHDFEVRALNAIGPGAWSSTLSAAPLPALDLPDPPTGLTATGGFESIALNWTAPTVGPGHDPILSYELRTREIDGAWSSTLRTVTAPTTNLSVTGYADERPREWAVRSVSADGHSVWSSAATASALITPAAPTNLSATRGDGAVALNWLAATTGGAATTYTALGRVQGSGSWTITKSVSAPSLSTNITGLTNGVTYEFAVRADKGVLLSPLSTLATATPAGLPAAPQTLTLQPANNALNAAWAAPTNTGGLPITYELRHKLSSTSTWSAVQPVSGTSTTITGLNNGSIYDVSVRAVNAVGSGGWSSTVSGSPSTVPGAPQDLALTAGDELVNAAWSPPASNGGVAVSGYEVRSRPSGGAWGAVQPLTSASYSFVGLTNGQSYEFAVRAVNARGVGDWITASATPDDADEIAPGAPTGISAEVSATNDAVALAWSPPTTGGAAATYETRTCMQDTPAVCSPTQVVSAPAVGASITNALTGAYIRASVRAVNPGGASGWVTSSAIYNPHVTLPVMRIETAARAPIVSKETYIPATYTLNANGSSLVSSVTTAADTEIRGRGNSTWSAPKKPYRLKLKDSTTLLSGVSKSKHWALLANYYDPSALRNAVAMRLGAQVSGLAWTPASQFVEVVLNGQYVGLYQLIETVRVDSTRVNVDAMKPADLAEPNLTGGYMFEIDGRLDGPVTNTFTTGHLADIVIQDPENAAAEQKNYLRNYMNSFESALYGVNFTDPTTGWRAYMDEASMIDWYLVNEFVANNDAMYSSTDLYKPRGGKVKWGPLWDYDQSIGRGWYYHPPNEWWVRSGGAGITEMAPWFTRLFQDPAFLSAVKSRWQALAPVFAAAAGYAGSIAPGLSTAAGQSESIWPKLSAALQGAETSFAAATPVVQDWLQQRYNWMNSPAQYGSN